MSLALSVDIHEADAGRIAAAAGALMATTLVLAAWEQGGLAAGAGWLPLGCAAASAVWCLGLYRRSRRKQSLCLQVSAEGLLRLVSPGSGEAVAVGVVAAWGIGHFMGLRLRPAVAAEQAAANGRQPAGRPSAAGFGSADCWLVLARWSFSEARWHGLRRWLVWYRRSRHGESCLVNSLRPEAG
jgi:hypothetical protein